MDLFFVPKRSARERVVLVLCLATIFAISPSGRGLAQNGGAQKPNYDLAAAWTAQKVGRLVFDTSVAPRWLEAGDRFWYSYQTREGRRFYLVDPTRKVKAPLFDHAKTAAALTSMIGQPYDQQHLPFTTVRFVKKDAAFQFDVQVPRDLQINTKPKSKTKTTGLDPAPSDGDRSGDDGLATAAADDQQQQRGQAAAGAAPPPRPRTLHFEYDLASGNLELLDDDYQAPRRPRWASVSPEGKTILFARNHNLYMMDAASYTLAQKKSDDPGIVETQLTKDGEEHYSFALTVRPGTQREQQQEEEQVEAEQVTDKNARVPPVTIVWSKDSRKFALVRRDLRKVADLWVIDALATPRPKLETYRYAMPGEVNVPQSEMLVFDLASKGIVKIKADRFKDQSLQIATAPSRQGAGTGQRGTGADVEEPPPPPQWLSDTPDKLYLTRQGRDLHKLDVCLANPETGEVKTLVEERLNTYIETKPLRLANNQQDLIFWSERTGWGHFYLYDANTGALKNAITSGEFVTSSIEGIDEKPAAAAPATAAKASAKAPAQVPVMYFTAVGREPNEDPYYPHLYRVNLDGSGLKLLNPGNANHAVNVSQSTKYFIDNASRVDDTPSSVLHDAMGNVVTKLETTDLTALTEAGFKFAEPFKVKADDGITDLYGVMYKPFDLDATKKYPVVLYVYPGPQTESVTKIFNPRASSVTLAQYGFIVVEVGNRGGNPARSKWYHNYGYGNLRDYGLADKKAAVEQLAQRHPFIDINRVGIWGHSGGGFMSAAAILVYPDFFKVAFSESGNHENNIYNNTWSEKHNGIKEVTGKDGNVTFEYSIEKNSELAKNLRGHLMLVTGDIDNNVHPSNTYRLADALIKANKRFDMLVIPGARHGFGAAGAYVNMIRADYFCRHLLGQAADSVDITELNREREQVGDKRPRRQ